MAVSMASNSTKPRGTANSGPPSAFAAVNRRGAMTSVATSISAEATSMVGNGPSCTDNRKMANIEPMKPPTL